MHERSEDRCTDPVDLMLRRARKSALQNALLLALPTALWHCASAPPAPPLPPAPEPEASSEPKTQLSLCAPGASFPVLASQLTPAVAQDYVAIRQVGASPDQNGKAGAWTRSDYQVWSEQGKACETATRPACAAKVAKHPELATAPHCIQACSEVSVIVTRGNEVRHAASAAELSELLRPIDTPAEALLLAHAHHYDVSCDPESTRVRKVEGGFDVFATRMTAMCAPIIITGYELHVSSEGVLREVSSKEVSRSNACVGRRPAGLICEVAQARESYAAFLAECAALEAASVLAFERLMAELTLYGAPPELVELAARARTDEIRHTHEVSALAERRGAKVRSVKLEAVPARSLKAIAIENAVEGCVRETFGALIGAFQAEHAQDLELRASMRQIADDELAHAAVSQRVHRWLMTQLDADAQSQTRAAMKGAIAELIARPTDGLPSEVRRDAGLPSQAQAHVMLAALGREVWSSALA